MKTSLHSLKRRISELAADRRGQTMIEYALLAGFLAVAGALFLGRTGESVGTTYANVAQVLDADATNGGAPGAGSPPPSSPSDDNDGNGGGTDSGGDSGGNGNGNGNDGNGGGNGNGGNGGGNGNGNGGKK